MAPESRHALVKAAAFLLMSLPGLDLALQLASGALAANPYPTIIRESGLWSFRLLLAGLAVTPLAVEAGWTELARLRRMIGLFAAVYATLHLAAWAKDYGFDWGFLWTEIRSRAYLAIGFAAALALVPLVATSNQPAVRRIGGRGWRRLHRLTYPIAGAAFLHYWMARRALPIELLLQGALLTLLLAWRLTRGRGYRGRSGIP